LPTWLPARGGDGHVGGCRGDLRWPAELQEDDGRDELRFATTSRLHAESLFEPPLVALWAILVPAVEEEPLIRHGVERLPEEVARSEEQVIAHPANCQATEARPHDTVSGCVRCTTTSLTRLDGGVVQHTESLSLGAVEDTK